MDLRCRSIVLIGIFFLTEMTAAQSEDVYVPEELEPWRAWVLHEQEYRGCPFFYNAEPAARGDFVCAWPDTLNISATASGGTFSQRWRVYAGDQWVPLPGDLNHWPQAVTVDGTAAPVVQRGNVPSIRLPPGRYRLSGNFAWNEMPRTLAVPPQSGLLELTVGNERVARPRRNGNSIWLGEQQQEKKVEDAVKVEVYRLITDDVPTRIETAIILEVAGSVREELLGPALPEGFVPLAIGSELPARLESDGNLRLQVRPGYWEIRLSARGPAVLDSVTLPEPKHNLPSSEIWSYRSADRIRVTAAESSRPVDPSQTSVPGEWQWLPAFRLQPGEALTISERSRGIVDADNRLSVDRNLWLDFSGDGFVFADAVSGEMRSEWRLDMAAPYLLQSAQEDDENLLITRNGSNSGVEVRLPDVDLDALGRLDSRGEFPVTGWLSAVDDMSMLLYLPPGHKLLAAPGADSAPSSWTGRWQLLDFFLLLIVTIATARLFGRVAGAIALLALLLSFHESGAPVWSWLNLLAAIALFRVAPEGRLRNAMKYYRIASVAVLLAILVPFAVMQIRVALYPQLEQRGAPVPTPDFTLYGAGDPKSVSMVHMDTAPAAEALRSRPETEDDLAMEEIVLTARKAAFSFSRYAENALVQTGPGIPNWSWHKHRLEWSGRVEPDGTMRLLVVPPWAVTLWRLLSVAMLAAFATLFLLETAGRKWQLALPGSTGRSGSVLGLFAVTLLIAGNPWLADSAYAETPPPQILQELQQRLLEPPPCKPNCAEVVSATADIGESLLTMRLSVHAQEQVAVPLPGSANGWRPERITIDGAAAGEVYRSQNDVLWIRLDAGRHDVDLRGSLPPVDSLEIPFAAAPRVIAAQSDYWFVAGIDDRRLIAGSLNLTRLQQSADSDSPSRWESSRFPAFVRIERVVQMDLDWRVTTGVYRVAPQQGALSMSVPLLEGEAIVSGEFTVADGEVLVSMNPDQHYVQWQSTIPRTSPMILTAAAGKPWKDVWRFAIGSIWKVRFDGVPESESSDSGSEARIAEFYPRSGETLMVNADRPEAIAGNTLAIDSVNLTTEIGERSRTTNMTLAYRSTRGSQHVFRLPANSQVNEVTIDGQLEPLRALEDQLTVPILPGEHDVSISWQNTAEVGALERTPVVDLAARSSNIRMRMTLPLDRWVLFTRGPSLGPAVLYWSELVALVLLAAVLGRIRITPLRTRHWVLLGLGFSTFSWSALLVVVLWLLAVGARKSTKRDLRNWQFNVAQVGVAFLSLGALLSIVTVLPNGLLGTPNMHITGFESYGNTLSWFADRTDSQIPLASVVSLPMWTYKVLILVWALWLSFSILRWLPWAWEACTSQGLWRGRKSKQSSKQSSKWPSKQPTDPTGGSSGVSNEE